MPKMKGNSGAKKRFKKTASGKIKRWRTGHRHHLSLKSPSRKRHLRSGAMVKDVDIARVEKMLL